jgi:anti-sigma B factor antagonist
MSKIGDLVRLLIEWLRNRKQNVGREDCAGDFMSFYINMEQTGDVAVLQCAGRMVRTQALSLLKDAVTSLSELRVTVLDLSKVEIIDAGGLGMLVSLHNWACVNGIQLKLVQPSKPVRQMLELTRLTSVLDISSVEDVVKIFCTTDRAIEDVAGAVA